MAIRHYTIITASTSDEDAPTPTPEQEFLNLLERLVAAAQRLRLPPPSDETPGRTRPDAKDPKG
jgi:hypothetical protein